MVEPLFLESVLNRYLGRGWRIVWSLWKVEMENTQ